jgi:hypothetical protein
MNKAAKQRFRVDPEHFIEETIKSYVSNRPLNCFCDLDSEPIFEEPLLGFVDEYEPLFEKYKTIISYFHLTLHEVLN